MVQEATLECPAYVAHAGLRAWIEEMVELCKPDAVYWCDGSDEEYQSLCEQMVDAGTLLRLNPAKRPNSFLARSDPSDVARMEDRTFVCTRRQSDAGPMNNWVDPEVMKATMRG